MKIPWSQNKNHASGFQKGWIVEVRRTGWVAFKLHWR
jgi:hypothetical protein